MILPSFIVRTLTPLLLLTSITTQSMAEDTSLGKTYEPFFKVGTSVNPRNYADWDSQDAKLIAKHFNVLTAENAMKWERIHPHLGEYNFKQSDKLIQFASEHNIKVVGHTLVWHSQTPEWVFQDSEGKPLTREALLKRMKAHITKVVGRYKGKVIGWDVVNEALNEDGTLRDSPWLRIIGEDYIEKAFEYAYEADPNTQLYYNDYRLEVPSKCAGAVAIVKRIQAAGVRIDGVGIQGHVNLTEPSVAEQEATILAVHKTGVFAMITEMDVDVLPGSKGWGDAEIHRKEAQNPKFNPYVKGLPLEVQKQLADRYAQLFRMYLKNKDKITRVTLWGLNDKDSWLNFFPIPWRTNYPLLFDRNDRPKLAFYAVLNEGLKEREQ